MYRIAICDDIPAVVDYIYNIIEDTFGAEFSISKFYTAIELERNFYRGVNCGFEILILDVELGLENGIDFAKELYKKHPEVKTIFISGKLNHVTETYDIKPVYFLAKPIDRNKLISAINIAVKDILESEKDIVRLMANNQIVRISQKRTVCLERIGRNVTVYETGGSVGTQFRLSMEFIQRRLPDKFCRCHQAYIINMDFVNEIKRFHFLMYDDKKIPIGQLRFNEVKEKFIRYLERRV